MPEIAFRIRMEEPHTITPSQIASLLTSGDHRVTGWEPEVDADKMAQVEGCSPDEYIEPDFSDAVLVRVQVHSGGYPDANAVRDAIKKHRSVQHVTWIEKASNPEFLIRPTHAYPEELLTGPVAHVQG